MLQLQGIEIRNSNSVPTIIIIFFTQQSEVWCNRTLFSQYSHVLTGKYKAIILRGKDIAFSLQLFFFQIKGFRSSAGRRAHVSIKEQQRFRILS